MVRAGMAAVMTWNIYRTNNIDTISCTRNGVLIAFGTNKVFYPSEKFRDRIVTLFKNKSYIIEIKNAKNKDTGLYSCTVFETVHSNFRKYIEKIKVIVTGTDSEFFFT